MIFSQQDQIAHLYRRAGFGLSPTEWQQKRGQPLSSQIDLLFQEAKQAKPPSYNSAYANLSPQEFKQLPKEQKKELLKKDKANIGEQSANWIRRMADPSQPALLERMTLFWHGHFACSSKRSDFVAKQLETLREHALGNFRDMLIAISKDPAMLRYLNNQQNKKNKPNENYARELMELFTIGRGHYTEQDIKEAARAFTGWMSGPLGRFFLNRRQHDYGEKIFMGKRGNFNGEDIIDIILQRRETAQFIAAKLYRYFVNDQINAREADQLAKVLYNSKYDIGHTMRYLFSSDWFYRQQHIGAKIKSPVELVAGMLRSLGGQFDKARPVLGLQKALGQLLFNPPNVAGWPGGTRWIDNSTLLLRLNLAGAVFLSADIAYRPKADLKAMQRGGKLGKLEVQLDFDPVYQLVADSDERLLFRQLSSYLLPNGTRIKESSMRPYLIKDSRESLIKSMVVRIMGLPEYQTC